MTDARIRADDPVVPYMTAFPSFYVGQRVIDSGADAVLLFARAYVESARVTTTQRAAVAVLTARGVPAEVQPGDSPGSDTWIFVGNLGGGYIGAYVHDAGTPGTYYIQAYDRDGNPAADPVVAHVGAEPAAIAAAIVAYALDTG